MNWNTAVGKRHLRKQWKERDRRLRVGRSFHWCVYKFWKSITPGLVDHLLELSERMQSEDIVA